MLPNLRELARSGVVAANVQSTLRLTISAPELLRRLDATVLGGPDRRFVRNGLIGGLVGLLLGSASMFVLTSGRRGVVAAGGGDGDVSKRERLLDQRVKGVTARERALATRAGELAPREQELEARAARLTAEERDLGARAGDVESSRRELADRASQIAASQAELQALVSAPLPPLPRARAGERTRPRPARSGWNMESQRPAEGS